MSWISDILQAIKAPKEHRKLGLEVKKLEKDASLIKIASDEEIAKFDPKQQQLRQSIEKHYPDLNAPTSKAMRGVSLVIGLGMVAAVILLLEKC